MQKQITRALTLATLLIASGLVASCLSDPVSSAGSSNGEVPAGVIARLDNGCEIYRFRDGSSSSKYFVLCPNADTSTTSTESCGKSCTRDVEVPTVTIGDPVVRP